MEHPLSCFRATPRRRESVLLIRHLRLLFNIIWSILGLQPRGERKEIMSIKHALTAAFISFAFSAVCITACGPSIRRTYQSDMAFEGCFDLDYDPQAPDDTKSECWRVWLDQQIYNQPDDKIQYAEMRRVELAQGISIPGPPGPPGQFFKRPKLLVDASVSRSIDGGLADGGLLLSSEQDAGLTSRTSD